MSQLVFAQLASNQWTTAFALPKNALFRRNARNLRCRKKQTMHAINKLKNLHFCLYAPTTLFPCKIGKHSTTITLGKVQKLVEYGPSTIKLLYCTDVLTKWNNYFTLILRLGTPAPGWSEASLWQQWLFPLPTPWSFGPPWRKSLISRKKDHWF